MSLAPTAGMTYAKLVCPILLFGLGACVDRQPPSRPLSQLPAVRAMVDVDLVSQPPTVKVELLAASNATPEPGDCPKLANDAAATFNGAPMSLRSNGGYDSELFDDTQCTEIYFTLDAPLTSEDDTGFVLHDQSGTWAIAGSHPLANDLAITSRHPKTVVTWSSAETIDSATLQLIDRSGKERFSDQGVAPAGNTIELDEAPPIAGVLVVRASRRPALTRCEGPASCMLFVNGGLAVDTTAAVELTKVIEQRPL